MQRHTLKRFYPMDRLEKIDKIVIILTGQPRGVTLHTWKRNFVDVIRDFAREYKKELYVFCATWKYDCLDRYLKEDPTKAGLGPVALDIDFAEHMYSYNYDTDLNKKIFKGLIPIKKYKWESFQRGLWGSESKVYFSYIDPYELLNKYNNLTGPESWSNTPSWLGQFIMIDGVYHDHKEIFDTFTKKTFALRARWDLEFDRSIGGSISTMVKCVMGNYRYDTFNILPGGLDLSPVMGAQTIWFIKGFPVINDYWQAYDGPGIQLLGQKLMDYLKQDPARRLLGPSNKSIALNTTAPQIPDRKNRYYKTPENIISEFHYDNFYTVYSESSFLRLQSFITWITDQWRYEWYDWSHLPKK